MTAGTKYMVQYDETGRITGTLSCDPRSFDANKNGLWLEGRGSMFTDYVLDGQVQPRPQMPATLDGMTLKGLPVPCQLHINYTEYTCNEPRVELSFDQPGTYRLKLTAWPYLDKEFDLEN